MHTDKRNGQGRGVMSIPPESPQWLRCCGVTVIQLLFLATAFVVLAAPSALATEPLPQSVASEALRPYFGKWRPTSFSKELHMVSITIAETGLSIETGGSVTYEFVKKVDEGAIVRVTGRRPVNPNFDLTQPGTTAFGFSLDTQTLDSFPPGGPSKTREILQICHGFGSIESAVKQLMSEMKIKRCQYSTGYRR